MRNPDVSQDEMMIGRLDDAGLDDLIEGRDGDGPASLRELFDAIRIEAEATPPCVPSAALERYVRPPSAAPRVRRRSRRSRAAVGAAAFAGTLAGKLVLGATVAAASVGVAHFAHVIDVPGLPARPLLIVSDEGVSEGDTADDAKLPSDLIEGEGGSDRIWGGPGLDTLNGGSGADRIWGGPDADIINGQGGKDFIKGDAGDDDIQGNHQSDVINGGTGNDVLRGAGGKDTLFGDGGTDELFGGDNSDALDGGPGNDLLNGQKGRDTCTSGGGVDTFISC